MYISGLDFTLMREPLPFILQGLSYTLGIALTSFLLGNFLGFLLTLLNLFPSKVIQSLVRVWFSFFRGVPALVLLFTLYFGLPFQLHPLTASIICFTLTGSAFMGEIYRGSILGIDSGQWDAAYALGFNFTKTMRLIIMPQAFRISVPALSNVAMDILKGTSLAAMITIPDIFQNAKIVGGRSFDFMSMYVLVAIIYWVLCLVIQAIQQRLEGYFAKRYGMSFRVKK